MCGEGLGLAVCGEGFGLAVCGEGLEVAVSGEGLRPRVSRVIRVRLELGLDVYIIMYFHSTKPSY